MPTLHMYQLLDKKLPAVLAAGLVELAFIVVVTVIILKGCCCFKGDRKWVAPLVFIETVKLYFPDIKIETEESDTKRDIQIKIKILEHEMDKYFFCLMSVLLIPIIVGTMFITFWNVYLVEEAVRGDFEDNFDCFPKIENDYLQKEPVSSRSVYELNNTVTYECYRLVFRYAEGLGAAGGILIFTGVISKLYFALLVTICSNVKNEDSNNDSKICTRTCCCRFLLYGIVWAVAITIFILFIAISVGVSVFEETIFQTTTYQIQFAMYALSLLVIIVSGVVVAIGIEIENYKTRNTEGKKGTRQKKVQKRDKIAKYKKGKDGGIGEETYVFITEEENDE